MVRIQNKYVKILSLTMKILVIEDNEGIADAIFEDLTDQNYTVEVANDGQAGLDLAESFGYDLILLDRMLPKLDGTTVCRKLRSQGDQTPILMLTAKDTIDDRVTGLDAGADDYLSKPFELKELAARIRALLRRGNTTLPPVLEWGPLTLNPSTCEVFYDQVLVPLSPKEYSLLELFLRHPNQVFTRNQIIDHLWSCDQFPGEATVKVHIRSVRMKLKEAQCSEDVIDTVYGIGYRLKSFS
jgi:DNA-binding response OmpR family regulator